MRNFTVAILTVLTLFTVSFSQPTWTQSGNIYTLTVGDMVFKVNADYGARITSFTINGTEILYTSGDMSGSTFWPSPQSEWNWPPPEPLDSDAYSATLQAGNTELDLQSGVDGTTGYQFNKLIYGDNDENSITIEYTITNKSGSSKSVAPWEITRVQSGGITFFPRGSSYTGSSSLNATINGDSVWFQHSGQNDQKMFRDGAESWIAHLDGDILLIKMYGTDISTSQFAPEESEIEIYAASNYVEVENQGAYASLNNNASVTWTVKWYLREVPGSVNKSVGSEELLDYVRSVLNNEVMNNDPTDISLSNSEVDENEPAGTEVGTFTTTDPDIDDSHTYTLVSGSGSDDNSSFTIDDESLLTAEAFDYDIKSSYSIRVQTDDGNGGTYQEEFIITVNEVQIPPPKFTLDITINGSGEVTVSPEPDQGEYDSGTVVTLTAEPDSGYEFINWEGGDISGSDNPMALFMDSDRDVIANFGLITGIRELVLNDPKQNHIAGNAKCSNYKSIQFSLSSPQNISMNIIDTRGITATTIFNGHLIKGVHRISFPTQSLSGGVYIIILKGEKIEIRRKFLKL